MRLWGKMIIPSRRLLLALRIKVNEIFKKAKKEMPGQGEECDLIEQMLEIFYQEFKSMRERVDI